MAILFFRFLTLSVRTAGDDGRWLGFLPSAFYSHNLYHPSFVVNVPAPLFIGPIPISQRDGRKSEVLLHDSRAQSVLRRRHCDLVLCNGISTLGHERPEVRGRIDSGE